MLSHPCRAKLCVFRSATKQRLVCANWELTLTYAEQVTFDQVVSLEQGSERDEVNYRLDHFLCQGSYIKHLSLRKISCFAYGSMYRVRLTNKSIIFGPRLAWEPYIIVGLE